MGRCNQHGSKSQRQNQHQRRLMRKIENHTKRGWKVEGLEKELAFSMGDTKRPAFKTGRNADSRFQKRWGSDND
jgi:hypothetical protein